MAHGVADQLDGTATEANASSAAVATAASAVADGSMTATEVAAAKHAQEAARDLEAIEVQRRLEAGELPAEIRASNAKQAKSNEVRAGETSSGRDAGAGSPPASGEPGRDDKGRFTGEKAEQQGEADDKANPDAPGAGKQPADAHALSVRQLLRRDGLDAETIDEIIKSPKLAAKYDAKWVEKRSAHHRHQDEYSARMRKLEAENQTLRTGGAAALDPVAALRGEITEHLNDIGDSKLADLMGKFMDLATGTAKTAGRGESARTDSLDDESETPDGDHAGQGRGSQGGPRETRANADPAALDAALKAPIWEDLGKTYPTLALRGVRQEVLEQADRWIKQGIVSREDDVTIVIREAAQAVLGRLQSDTHTAQVAMLKRTAAAERSGQVAGAGQRPRADAAAPRSNTTEAERDREAVEAQRLLATGKSPAEVRRLLQRGIHA